MNPIQQQYEDSLQIVRYQIHQARNLNRVAHIEWLHEVKKLLQDEMGATDFTTYDEDEF